MQKIDEQAKILWDYMHLNQPLQKSDAILVLGSRDLETAERACDLYFQGYAPIIIFSGNHGKKIFLPKPEAEMFRDIAIKRGVPTYVVFIENKSTSTGENIAFTKELILENNLTIKSMIVVQKPYVERRVYATLKKQWSEINFTVTSQPIFFDDYTNKNSHYSRDEIISNLVGDFQRIVEYPKLGFQIPQEVPKQALEAFNFLVEAGFTDKLIQ